MSGTLIGSAFDRGGLVAAVLVILAVAGVYVLKNSIEPLNKLRDASVARKGKLRALQSKDDATAIAQLLGLLDEERAHRASDEARFQKALAERDRKNDTVEAENDVLRNRLIDQRSEYERKFIDLEARLRQALDEVARVRRRIENTPPEAAR